MMIYAGGNLSGLSYLPSLNLENSGFTRNEEFQLSDLKTPSSIDFGFEDYTPINIEDNTPYVATAIDTYKFRKKTGPITEYFRQLEAEKEAERLAEQQKITDFQDYVSGLDNMALTESIQQQGEQDWIDEFVSNVREMDFSQYRPSQDLPQTQNWIRSDPYNQNFSRLDYENFLALLKPRTW